MQLNSWERRTFFQTVLLSKTCSIKGPERHDDVAHSSSGGKARPGGITPTGILARDQGSLRGLFLYPPPETLLLPDFDAAATGPKPNLRANSLTHQANMQGRETNDTGNDRR
jgi:hypothetical protein